MRYRIVPGPTCLSCLAEIQKPAEIEMDLFRVGVPLHRVCAEQLRAQAAGPDRLSPAQRALLAKMGFEAR